MTAHNHQEECILSSDAVEERVATQIRFQEPYKLSSWIAYEETIHTKNRVYRWYRPSQLVKKFYVGSSTNPKQRFSFYHNNTTNGQIKWERARQKYGIESFVCEVLDVEFSDVSSMLNTETAWVRWLEQVNHGYNCLHIAGSTVGNKWSNETRLKRKNRPPKVIPTTSQDESGIFQLTYPCQFRNPKSEHEVNCNRLYGFLRRNQSRLGKKFEHVRRYERKVIPSNITTSEGIVLPVVAKCFKRPKNEYERVCTRLYTRE